MKSREDGLLEIYNRIKDSKVSGFLPVKTFKRSPTIAIDQKDLPSVFMIEDVDTIIQHGSRDPLGYAAKRSLDVVLEIITSRPDDIKLFYRKCYCPD